MHYSPAIAGTAVIYCIAPTTATRIGLLIAFYCTQFILAEGNLLFSLISRNVAGQTKKSTVLAITFIAWAAGNATAPQVCLVMIYSCHRYSIPSPELYTDCIWIDLPIHRRTTLHERIYRTLLPLRAI